MRKKAKWFFLMVLVMLFASAVIFEYDAYARAGGGRSSGSSGSRSYSPPSRSTSNPASPSRQPTSPSSVPGQPAGGGFLRSMGGGILGGLMGGMLLGSLFGFGGMGGGGFGGSGVGIVELLLLGAAGYFVYTIVMKKRREGALAYQGSAPQGNYQTDGFTSYGKSSQAQVLDTSIPEGLAHIRQMDPMFDEVRFKDAAMDIFFKIQGAWTNRDLSSANMLLTDEIKSILQQDIDNLRREKKINRLENIAVRKAELVEAWQESGQDFIRVLFTANLLDYTVDEPTGAVIAGSKADPVKFEECWTVTRPVGNNPWKLSAINQV